MGRRALSVQEKADKAARERDRSRRYRAAALQNGVTLSGDSHLPVITSSHPSNFPQNSLIETAREGSSLLSMHLFYLKFNVGLTCFDLPAHGNEQQDIITLYQVVSYPVYGALRRSRTPSPNRSITTTHELPTIQVEETILQANDVSPHAICRPGRPKKDPALSPRAQTRLRVQRHRDQQHLTKAQQIVEQFDITQELPPTAEFSGLTLHDNPASPISANEAQPRPVCRSDSEPGPESGAEPIPLSSPPRDLNTYVEDGDDSDISENFRLANDAVPDLSIPVSPSSTGSTQHNSQSPQHRNSASSPTPTPPASSPSPLPSKSSIRSVGRDESILSGYLEAINEQDTAGGPDFLRLQGDVYDRVLRAFFSHQCNCPSSHEHAEPENTQTLQEHTDYISRYLPPLPTIFAKRDSACDPRASFPQWQSFLSDQPAEPLSFRKTQASLSQDAVTIARQWDVDSVWFGARSLSAIRAPNQFRLSFFSPHTSNISTAQVIQPHGLDLAHTRHTIIGTFITAGVRFSVLMFFPSGAPSQTRASTNSLSLARFRDLYDEIILPAVRETVPIHVRQEIPGSYDLIYAKSRAYQEKPGAGRWSAEDESRSYRLAYGIPASVLPQFWAVVVRNANRHRLQSKKGDAVPYFQNPRLLFQAHDLKNMFASESLQDSLDLFRDSILAGLDPSQIDMHSCWLDVGMRDHVLMPPASSNGESQNHHHLLYQLPRVSGPDTRFDGPCPLVLGPDTRNHGPCMPRTPVTTDQMV
ncbi:hypothetical protein FOYG_17312 [Fusarium oxysporum NRRL 32931]|uniref:Uncharacterized protein n=1 Tax=Fusarium oxysporum NRRL 32931 TaxID=660029 RepID=W9HHA0_FUSOX|nr:hypothetical protein FOYG_17312 [Fusarium oxysporum NRRL 32931]